MTVIVNIRLILSYLNVLFSSLVMKNTALWNSRYKIKDDYQFELRQVWYTVKCHFRCSNPLKTRRIIFPKHFVKGKRTSEVARFVLLLGSITVFAFYVFTTIKVWISIDLYSLPCRLEPYRRRQHNEMYWPLKYLQHWRTLFLK